MSFHQRGIVLDLDGVITDTAIVHFKAWKSTFDSILLSLNMNLSFTMEDYLSCVDGRSRLIGIRTYVDASGMNILSLPANSECRTIDGIADFKNKIFLRMLRSSGVKVFDDALGLITAAKSKNIPLGLASSSKNAKAVLSSVGLLGAFDAVFDGAEAEQKKVASKPNGEFYSMAANVLGLKPGLCVAVEDAVSGVASAVGGGMGLVIGVARLQNSAALKSAGADLVCENLETAYDKVFDFVCEGGRSK
ncbi:HAD-IA family hydrolase [Thalassospira sp. MA62]|nr:HAD-IA family hydrolase [Thalassospira sp. MA62]